jgi:hypothetical protein
MAANHAKRVLSNFPEDRAESLHQKRKPENAGMARAVRKQDGETKHPMKYLLSLTAIAVYAIATSGCVSVEDDEPETTSTTRTTTVDTPLTPAVSSSTTTTTY